ncbi:hypothetical protein HanXRQr2_Chr13g0616671 [Helianthus annuus]|nr:hypothetical protein HanXRQr2_Chr13g0616671 [Helianthus annuus]
MPIRELGSKILTVKADEVTLEITYHRLKNKSTFIQILLRNITWINNDDMIRLFNIYYQVRRLEKGDFQSAMTVIRPSIVRNKWEELEEWNKVFGSN